MKTLSFLALLTVTVAVDVSEPHARLQFAKFMADHEKMYGTRSEELYRFEVFNTNLKKIMEHNEAGHSYKMGINEFSDLTQEEFESRHLGGYKGFNQHHATNVLSSSGSPKVNSNLPESVDWRDKGVVSPVKNQGHCGSCWAFATTAVIESYAAINGGGDVPILSTQQVTSCAPNTLNCGGTGGCYGSIAQLGYSYIQLFGHVTEEDYPYKSGTSGQTGSCGYDISDTPPVVGLTGYDSISNDQDAIMNHLATVGPLAVSVAASQWGSYSSGVFTGCSFDANIAINHAVVLVGYGTDAVDGDYWIVRNSWGSSWGEDGYIRLQRQSKAQCGVNSTPMDGTACVGGPGNDEQTVCGQCGILFDVSYPLGVHSIKH